MRGEANRREDEREGKGRRMGRPNVVYDNEAVIYIVSLLRAEILDESQ
jgi:hypothetical protein